MKDVLILCTGNSCRSQMAEGYLRHFAADRALIKSAGVETHGVNPRDMIRDYCAFVRFNLFDAAIF